MGMGNSSMLFAQRGPSDNKIADEPKNPITHKKIALPIANGDFTHIEEVPDPVHKKLLIAEDNTITLVNLSTEEKKSFPIACKTLAAFPQGQVAIGLRDQNILKVYETSDLNSNKFKIIVLSAPAKHIAIVDKHRLLIVDKNNEMSVLDIKTGKRIVILKQLNDIRSVNVCLNGDIILHRVDDKANHKLYRLQLQPSNDSPVDKLSEKTDEDTSDENQLQIKDFSPIKIAEEFGSIIPLAGGKIATLSKLGDHINLWEIEENSTLKLKKLSSCGSTEAIASLSCFQAFPHERYLVAFDSIHFAFRFWEVTEDNKVIERDTCKLPENENYLRHCKVLEDGSMALVTRNFLMTLQYAPQQELQESITRVNAMIHSNQFRNLTQHPLELRHITATYLFRESKIEGNGKSNGANGVAPTNPSCPTPK